MNMRPLLLHGMIFQKVYQFENIQRNFKILRVGYLYSLLTFHGVKFYLLDISVLIFNWMFALFRIMIVMIICLCVWTTREDRIPTYPCAVNYSWLTVLHYFPSLSLCSQVATIDRRVPLSFISLYLFLCRHMVWGKSAPLTHMLQYSSH